MASDVIIDRSHPDYLRERIAELEAQLAERDWSPITQDNLPRVGDEVWGDTRKMLEVEEWHVGYFTADPRVWIQSGYTHRRPINAPLAAPAPLKEE
jgi:hypothetical protein